MLIYIVLRTSQILIESVKNFGLIGLYILEPAEPLPPMSEEEIEFERYQTIGVFSIKGPLPFVQILIMQCIVTV